MMWWKRFLYAVCGLLVLGSISKATKINIYDVSGRVISEVNLLRSGVLTEVSRFGVSLGTFERMWGSARRAFEEGIYPFEYSPSLVVSAENYLRNIELSGFSSSVSPLLSFSVVGVAFEKNISTETALSLLLYTLLKDAVYAKPYASSLLFPLYTELGAVLGVTSISVGGQPYNMYILVVAVGMSDEPPGGSYFLGLLSPKERSPVFWEDGKKVPATVWPNGLFYAPMLSSECYVSIEEFKGGRWVRNLYGIRPVVPITLVEF